MGALGDVCTNTVINPALNVTVIQHITGEVDSDDTFTINLNDFGCTLIHGIKGWAQATADQPIEEAPTTAVASGVLTVTVKGSSVDSVVRMYAIWAY